MRHPALDLVNSLHVRAADVTEDRLDDPQWLAAFGRRWSLPTLDFESRASGLRELRELLRALIDELSATHDLKPESLKALARFLPTKATRVVLERLDGGRFRVAHLAEERECAIERIATAFAELVAADGGQRIKSCDNRHCRWTFYDGSRNRSRRWCDSSECGNVMKARAFRLRQRAARKRGARRASPA
ncbi:MAG TPA: CGNR zinc finger domain-containing protein [Steroidobacteraceae bacterium]|jgi:predicted RNA-binding Zn ribbon-like protein